MGYGLEVKEIHIVETLILTEHINTVLGCFLFNSHATLQTRFYYYCFTEACRGKGTSLR